MFEGFVSVFCSPAIIGLIFAGVAVGIVFGAVPGLTATMAITICLPLTFRMDSITAISVLVALYIGGISGGLISAILLKIPGTPSSIATTFDGAPMADQGYAGRALGIGVFYSFLGTLFSMVLLVSIAPRLASVAIHFGPFEYCALTVFSLSLVISLAGKDFLKGLISAVLGIMFATVGLSPIDSYKRFTFNNSNLTSGFALLTVLIGLYAITEIASASYNASKDKEITVTPYSPIRGLGFTFKEFKNNIKNFFSSALIGTGIGILPGIGGGIAGMIAYSLQKTRSDQPQKFGTGCMEGIVASETANNAVIGGAMIPLLTLGIPGDGATAMLLGALMVHKVVPGPLIFEKYSSTVYAIYGAMFIAAVAMLIVEYIGMRGFIKILKIPRNFLLPLVIVLCCIGAFSNSNRTFDICAAVFFGIVGYLMVKTHLPAPPLVLGFILGPTFEENLRRCAQYITLDKTELYSHPIATALLLVTLIVVFFTLKSRIQQKI